MVSGILALIFLAVAMLSTFWLHAGDETDENNNGGMISTRYGLWHECQIVAVSELQARKLARLAGHLDPRANLTALGFTHLFRCNLVNKGRSSQCRKFWI